MSNGGNGWQEWSKHVLKELERLNDLYKSLNEKMSKLEIKLAVISTKQKAQMALYGAIGSAIPVAIGLAIWIIKSSSQ